MITNMAVPGGSKILEKWKGGGGNGKRPEVIFQTFHVFKFQTNGEENGDFFLKNSFHK